MDDEEEDRAEISANIDQIRAAIMSRPVGVAVEKAKQYLAKGYFEGFARDKTASIVAQWGIGGAITPAQHQALAGFIAFVDVADLE